MPCKWNLWNEEVVSEDITDKTDDIVVRRLSYGSNAFNNSHTALLNNYGEGDEVSKPANDEEEKLVVVWYPKACAV